MRVNYAQMGGRGRSLAFLFDRERERKKGPTPTALGCCVDGRAHCVYNQIHAASHWQKVLPGHGKAEETLVRVVGKLGGLKSSSEERTYAKENL